LREFAGGLLVGGTRVFERDGCDPVGGELCLG